MTNLDQKVQELRAFAEKATPGEWLHVEGERLSHDAEGWTEWAVVPAVVAIDAQRAIVETEEVRPEDAAYIAAACPSTLTAILDEYDRRGAALVEAEGATRAPGIQMIYELRHPEKGRVGWQDNADLMRSAADELERVYALSQEVGK